MPHLTKILIVNHFNLAFHLNKTKGVKNNVKVSLNNLYIMGILPSSSHVSFTNMVVLLGLKKTSRKT